MHSQNPAARAQRWSAQQWTTASEGTSSRTLSGRNLSSSGPRRRWTSWLDVTNPGLRMAHCHITEHNQSGMMFRFQTAILPRVTEEA